MSKNFKVTLAILLVLVIIGSIWGPGTVQARKMQEAKEWLETNDDMISKISHGDDLNLTVSTALYIRVSGKLKDKERIEEIKEAFETVDGPLPFKFMLSVKPNAVLPSEADSIIINVLGRTIKVSNPSIVKKLLGILSSNKGGNDHKCMSNGQVTIVNGVTETKLDLVPSHGDSEVEFRFNGKLFTVDRERFLSIEELSLFKNTISGKMDSKLEK